MDLQEMLFSLDHINECQVQKTRLDSFEMLTASFSGYSSLLPEADDFISLFQRNTSLEVFAERHVLSVGAY